MSKYLRALTSARETVEETTVFLLAEHPDSFSEVDLADLYDVTERLRNNLEDLEGAIADLEAAT